MSKGGSYHAERARRRSSTSSRSSRWAEARIGQFHSDDEIQSLTSSLDADFNAFAIQVCGPDGARSIVCTPTHPSLAGDFVERWTVLLGRWRNFRDDVRGDWLHFGGTLDEVQQFRTDLQRMQREYSERTGAQTVDPAQLPPREPGVLDRLAGAVGDAASGVGLGVGLAAIALLALVGLAEARR